MKYQYRKNDLLVLGRLMSDERRNELEHSPKRFFSIHRTIENELYATIEPISKQPSSFPTDYYETPVRYLYDFGLNDITNFDFDTQTNETLNFFSNRLIAFYPYKSDGGIHNNIDRNQMYFSPIPINYDFSSKYIGIPFYEPTLQYSTHDFQLALRDTKSLPCQHSISYDTEDNPPFIILKTEEEEYIAYGPLKSISIHGNYTKSEIITLDESLATYITIPDYIILRSISIENILFLDESSVEDIKSLLTLESKRNPLFTLNSININQQIFNIDNYQQDESPQTIINDAKSKANDTLINNEKFESEDYTTMSISQSKTSILSEKQFIDQFIAEVNAEKFVYQKSDLVNFHVAMKSSGLVILAGMSGTGKSRIVQLYGKSLGLSDEQVKIIPVRPFWTDDADVLGYLDTNHMLYRPAECGLVDTLIDANKHKDHLYIICFDEMNLARVEHYFSQFISVLENDSGKRILQLYNPSSESNVFNRYDYPAKIEVKDNVLFVGTVNIDESTFTFSDKILDRSNVIHLHRCSFQSLKDLTNTAGPEVSGEISSLPATMSATNYNEYRTLDLKIDMSDDETAFIDVLDQKLTSILPDGGIGYRIFRQMDEYLKSLPNTEYLTHKEAFDLQIAQRILTKLRGPEKLLSQLLTNKGKEQGTYLMDLFSSYKDLSSFDECRAILTKKENELIKYGYTL